MKVGVRDVRALGETLLVTLVTWFALGFQLFARTIHQADGQLLVDPFTRSALEAGSDWTQHLYRIGVLGGSKMHEFGGTPPLLQLCAGLGLSTSATVNVMSLFVQVAFGFFGLLVIDAMRAERGQRASLALPLRIGAIWICAFAPVLAWRLSVGHENLLFGLLPFVAAFALLWAARAQQLSAPALVFATFAVANGVSGLGAQMVVYGTVFGAPLALAVIADAPRGSRWTRAHWCAIAALAAGVLVVLPRMLPMLAHAAGPDATRTIDAQVTYSYGHSIVSDWIESLPWTPAATRATGLPISWHERNYPVGPLLLLLPLLCHRRRNAWLGVALGASVTLSLCFALDLHPISSALLRAIPPLEAFRVPARSMLPVVVVLPALLAGALASWLPLTAIDRRLGWAGVAAGLLAILGHRALGTWAPDAIGWPLGLAILVLVARGRLSPNFVAVAIVVLGALGVTSFEARFLHDLPLDRVEDGPTEVAIAVRAQLPANATVFDRVQIVDAPPPYLMSMAWAAGIPSLDGVWYPPARFARLVSTLTGEPVATTAAVFQLTASRGFAVLQQLYNVRLLVSMREASARLAPPTPGAAWFPRSIVEIDRPEEMAAALSNLGPKLASTVRDTAWVLRADRDATLPANCAGAGVERVATDAVGQTAVFAVHTRVACVLVVSTSYVSTLRARATTAAGEVGALVVPIDIALVGIVVPAGATAVELYPEVHVPTWTLLAALVGALLVLAAAVSVGPRERT